jgi:guanylate kinase
VQAYIRGAYYGTTYQSIEDTQANDKICIIDVDTQGVQNIKSSDLECKYLFVSPPTIEDLGE